MRILGIDPGSRFTGWGVIEHQASGGERHVASGVLRIPREASLSQRLVYLAEKLAAIIQKYVPQQAAIEGIFFARHPHNALILGQARGVALCTLAGAGLSVAEYTPAQIKRCTCDNGRADKQQIQRMVQLLLDLRDPPPQDAADALAVALTHSTMCSLPPVMLSQMQV